MKVSKSIFYLFLFSLPILVSATEYHVAVNGSDSNIGSKEMPFKTIQAAVNILKASDVCIVHSGIYREKIRINTSGNLEAPITIKAANGENPIITGLDVVKFNWQKSDAKNIMVADFDLTNVEQIFMDGKPMLEARWPNVSRDKNGDWNFFSPTVWADVDADCNTYGIIKDTDLASTGWDITGARANLNVNHQFYIWTRVVEGHSAGNPTFNYPKNLGPSIKETDEAKSHIKFNDDRYYLVGKKEFLDADGEWFYDAGSKKVYVYFGNGKNLSQSVFEIKTRNFALSAPETVNNIVIDGFTFFGTAFMFGTDLNRRSNNITIKNNQILYSSWTEYFNIPKEDPKAKLDENFPTIYAENSKVVNNVFAYGIVNAMFINGFSNIIENNEIHDFNTNSSLRCPPLEVNKNWPAYEGKGGKAIVRYNTIYNSGGILTQIGQADNDVYMNDLYNAFLSCWGGNKDVSALYSQSIYCVGTRMHHNWVHDMYAGTPPFDWNGGLGIRGDDNTSGLNVDHNVVWNTGSAGIMMKSPNNPTEAQANKVLNNTVFQHSKYNDVKSGIIVPSQNKFNMFSWVDNNLSETIYGQWSGKPMGNITDYSNNVTGEVVENLLENPTLFDFRPKNSAKSVIDKGKKLDKFTNSIIGSSPDIGAYEKGDSIYWIPGRREQKASFPIVSNNAKVDKERDVLMWRPVYQAKAHHVYLGNSAETMDLKSKFKGEQNVFQLPKLSNNCQYFWRVDAIMPDGSVLKGDVWSFSVGK